MSEVVRLERQGAVGIIRVDNPPVNALSQAVRQGILEALEAAQDSAEVRVVLLICEGRTFFAGADISEFGKPPWAVGSRPRSPATTASPPPPPRSGCQR